MKTKLLFALMAVILLMLPTKIVAQAPTLGTANDYVLFTSIGAFTSIHIENATMNNTYELRIYNLLAQQVIKIVLHEENTLLQTSQLTAGMYLYQIIKNNRTIQSGKLLSKQIN